MKSRCTYRHTKYYKNYGGRGIYVCQEWAKSFEVFLADMGPRPTVKHTIERKDNDGPYAPWNCRWATQAEQKENFRSNHWLEHMGRTQTIRQWATELGIKPSVISNRLRRHWPVNEVLDTPVTSRARLITTSGATKTVKEWASETGLSESLICFRLKSGWAAEQAVSVPAHTSYVGRRSIRR